MSKYWSEITKNIKPYVPGEQPKDRSRIKNSINSYTLDRLSMAGAKASFEDEAYFQEIGLKVINTRERVMPVLKELGFKVLESKANFLFVSHNTIKAKILFEELRNKGILVRYFNKPKGKYNVWL